MKKEEIQNLIKELIEKTTVSVQQIEVREEGGKTTWYSVEVNQPHFFLGRNGEALSALNHLVKRIVEVKQNLLSSPTLLSLSRVLTRTRSLELY